MNIKQSKLFAESWNVAFRLCPQGYVLNDKSVPFTVIPNDSNSWAADPMVFEYNGEIFIFAELYDYKLRHGVIGYTKYNGESFDRWKTIITEDFHMSYPFVFENNGSIYMIPETSEANKLILYKAVNFPDQWAVERVIKDGVKWADTTIFKLNDCYIGYTESVAGDIADYKLSLNTDLQIEKIDALCGELNKNRCGGRMFEYNDHIVRVCQDCSEKYGGALIFRFCDISNLEEVQSTKITPEQLDYNSNLYLDGIHTYSANSNIEVIDIKTRRFNFINLFYRLISKF